MTIYEEPFGRLRPFGVGFDEMFKKLDAIHNQPQGNYPPYNIVKLDEDAKKPLGLSSTLFIGIRELKCSPNIASTSGSFQTPSFIINLAPPASTGGGPSSAG